MLKRGKTTDVQFGLSFTAEAGDLPIMTFIKWTDRNFSRKRSAAEHRDKPFKRSAGSFYRIYRKMACKQEMDRGE